MAECESLGCIRPMKAKGYCEGHYQRLKRGQDPNLPLRPANRFRQDRCSKCEKRHVAMGFCQSHYDQHRSDPKNGYERCSVSGCDDAAKSLKLCATHYERSKRGADLDAPRRRWRDPAPGEWFKNAKGYMVRLSAPMENGRRKTESKHRVRMSEHLGRPLLPGEEVHHINTIRDDNRIENLELWVTSQPRGGRARDMIAWAKELIERYGDEDV